MMAQDQGFKHAKYGIPSTRWLTDPRQPKISSIRDRHSSERQLLSEQHIQEHRELSKKHFINWQNLYDRHLEELIVPLASEHLSSEGPAFAPAHSRRSSDARHLHHDHGQINRGLPIDKSRQKGITSNGQTRPGYIRYEVTQADFKNAYPQEDLAQQGNAATVGDPVKPRAGMQNEGWNGNQHYPHEIHSGNAPQDAKGTRQLHGQRRESASRHVKPGVVEQPLNAALRSREVPKFATPNRRGRSLTAELQELDRRDHSEYEPSNDSDDDPEYTTITTSGNPQTPTSSDEQCQESEQSSDASSDTESRWKKSFKAKFGKRKAINEDADVIVDGTQPAITTYFALSSNENQSSHRTPRENATRSRRADASTDQIIGHDHDEDSLLQDEVEALRDEDSALLAESHAEWMLNAPPMMTRSRKRQRQT